VAAFRIELLRPGARRGTEGPVGLVHVDMQVGRESGPRHTVRFLVDSGAAYSVLPTTVWQALGLQPLRTMDFVLADGTLIRRDVAHCFFTYAGVEAPGPVVLGESRDEALLGTITLEAMGLVLNPFERTLRPARLRLSATSPASCRPSTAAG
jgi:predicted aspartyl protease